jgi:DNA-binding GntR family transcriptional regulator
MATASNRGVVRSRPAAKVSVEHLNVSTYKRAAYLALRDMITELELPPGSRLVESDLAERLNVSKTPIREAIALLEADGLAEAAPYRGATVTWLSLHQMEEQGFLVDALELPALPMVVEQISREEIEEAGRIARQLKRAFLARDGRMFRGLTTEIHRILFASVGYPRLTKFISTLVGPVGLRYDRVFCDNFVDAWEAQLELLVGRYEGIKARDAAAAAEAVRAGRERIGVMNRLRLEDPRVAPYFRSD